MIAELLRENDMTIFSRSYLQYLNSSDWKAKRTERLALDDHRCTGCELTERLEVHHLTYERFGNERMTDLITMCHACHALHHGRTPDLPPVAGIESPKVARDRSRHWTYQSFLLRAQRLQEALEGFVVYANAMPTDYTERVAVLEEAAKAIFDEVDDEMRRYQTWA